MTHGILSKYAGIIAVCAGLVAASLYMLMITVTLAHLQAVSGLVPFDMRPLGYGPTEVAAMLEALGGDGRAYYLSSQIPLDTIYPAMLALTLCANILWLGRGVANRRIIHIGAALSIGCALFDYTENLGLVALIWGWPEVPEVLVYAVSAVTVLKSVTTTLAVGTVCLVGFHRTRSFAAALRA